MPALKLVYFPIKARAEPIRITLAIGGVPFEDVRIAFPEFSALKETLPLGQLPVMEIDGKTTCQSAALLRYAGKLSNLYPSDPLQALLVDQLIDTIEEINGELAPSLYEKDVEKKAAMREKLASITLPKKLSQIEGLLKMNGGKFAVGDALTIADVFLMTQVATLKRGLLDGIPTIICDGYPLIMKSYQAVNELPQVIAWEKAHPVSS